MQNQNYTVLDLLTDDPESRYLVYSKNDNSLPIVQTLFGLEPCLNAARTTRQSTFYPTEIERTGKCEIGADSRYQLVGYNVSLYDHYQ